MGIKELVETLHPLEVKVLPVLKKFTEFSEIVNSASLKDVEVMRALQWLQNKNIIKLKEDVKELIVLDTNGKTYLEKGLPEKRFLLAIDGETEINEILKIAGLEKSEIDICIGTLKSKAAIILSKDKVLKVNITPQGKKSLDKETLEEQFLKKTFPLELSSLKEEEKFAFQNLIKRKNILKTELVKTKFVELTDLGTKLLKQDIAVKGRIDRLTPALISSGKWKDKNFRSYDVRINVPKIHGGRRHFVNEATEYVKRIWLDLGFKEMKGQLLQTSFWNFDALFTAQDHPVRELQDTFFVKDPASGKLPDKKLVESVKKTHENGWDTGSKGWGYTWQPKDAMKNVLRTHTTVLSAQTLAKLTKKDLPAKFFSVGKCFRNETLDWSHLFELTQVEGIVVDPDANFKHLIGYLKEFFLKMGYDKVRVRPAYFPYTEPSAEVDVFHPVHKKWIELGGSGIFRPELVKPLLGEEVPVLAWGLGLERIVTEYYKINDLREIYANNLEQLRTIKSWLR